MPFYLVEQRGVPGARLIEAEKPAGAINHVVADLFSAKRVDNRALLDAAKKYDVEVAGAPRQEPGPEPEPADDQGGAPELKGGPVGGDVDPPQADGERNYDAHPVEPAFIEDDDEKPF